MVSHYRTQSFSRLFGHYFPHTFHKTVNISSVTQRVTIDCRLYTYVRGSAIWILKRYTPYDILRSSLLELNM